MTTTASYTPGGAPPHSIPSQTEKDAMHTTQTDFAALVGFARQMGVI